jgi:hypothetical protein
MFEGSASPVRPDLCQHIAPGWSGETDLPTKQKTLKGVYRAFELAQPSQTTRRREVATYRDGTLLG